MVTKKLVTKKPGSNARKAKTARIAVAKKKSFPRICFVLGAGASAPYGYPTGDALVKEMPGFDKNGTICDRGQFDTMRERIENSKARSVDLFLGRDPKQEFDVIGRAYIATKLVAREIHGNMFSRAIEDDWLEYALGTLLARVRDITTIEDWPISFVTFNYDRSLEHFLFTYLCNNFSETEAKVADLIKRINIVHVYGRFGPFKWEDKDNGRNYETAATQEQLWEESNRIIILHQADDDSENFKRARELFSNANQIILLGFGYHHDNLRRLQLPFSRAGKPSLQIFGTVCGMTQEEANQQRTSARGNLVIPEKVEYQCRAALRHNDRFLEAINQMAVALAKL